MCVQISQNISSQCEESVSSLVHGLLYTYVDLTNISPSVQQTNICYRYMYTKYSSNTKVYMHVHSCPCEMHAVANKCLESRLIITLLLLLLLNHFCHYLHLLYVHFFNRIIIRLHLCMAGLVCNKTWLFTFFTMYTSFEVLSAPNEMTRTVMD